VLHELATLKRAFLNDWDAREFDSTDSELQISVTTSPGFLQHHVSENIRDLLQRDPKKRPRASELCSIFSSYTTILEFACAQSLIDSPTYPEYIKWKQVMEKSTAQPKWLYQSALALTVLDAEEGNALATNLRNEMIQRFIDEESRRNPLDDSANHDEDVATLLLCRLGDSLVKEHRYDDAILIYSVMIGNHVTALAFARLSEAFILKDEVDKALHTYEQAIKAYPSNFWLWHDLCELYPKKTGWENAIELYKQKTKELPENPWPLMLLSSLYAAQGDYTEAIRIWEGTKLQCDYTQDDLLFPERVIHWDPVRNDFEAVLFSMFVLD
jgi:tetratricopeptide (TPR) repeat protein